MNSRVFSVAVAGAMGMSMVAVAAEPTQRELLEKIEALEAKVQKLEAEQSKGPTAQEVDRTVANIVQDADRHSRLLVDYGAFSGGWRNGKFTIESADGNWVISPSILFQFRGVTTYRSDVATPVRNASGVVIGRDVSDDWQDGFEVRRLKFGLSGNAISPKITYEFIWSTERNGGLFRLEDAWARYKFNDNWSVRAGQFKEPLFHEQMVSAKTQLAADRSLMNEILASGETYVQGAALIYEKGPMNAVAAFHDGYNNRNSNFQDFPTNSFNFGATGRVEYSLLSDNFKGYNDFSAMGNTGLLLVLGAATSWSQSDRDLIYHTMDAQWENDMGWGAYGAFVGRYTRGVPTVGDSERYDWGFVAQVGYLITPKWEVFGRYDYVYFDSASLPAGTERQVHEITTGVNYFMHGQAAKFTLDIGYLPNGCPVNADGMGILANDGNDEIVLRGQFQLLL
jgi:hypothetical protein